MAKKAKLTVTRKADGKVAVGGLYESTTESKNQTPKWSSSEVAILIDLAKMNKCVRKR